MPPARIVYVCASILLSGACGTSILFNGDSSRAGARAVRCARARSTAWRGARRAFTIILAHALSVLRNGVGDARVGARGARIPARVLYSTANGVTPTSARMMRGVRHYLYISYLSICA